MTAAAVYLSPVFKQRFVDDNNVPALNGKLFTYLAGTTTKANTYTDSTGLTPNQNPVLLDSRGEANVWLDQTLTYKVVLAPSTDTDPPTNAFWTVDNVPASVVALLAAASGASLVGFTEPTSTVKRTLQDKVREIEVSAAGYPGFDATQATVSDAAVQAAIDYCGGLPGGGTVRIPSCSIGTVFFRSNVDLKIQRGDVITMVQPTSDVQTGFLKDTGNLTSVRMFGGGKIDGARIDPAVAANGVNNVVYIGVNAGEVIEDIAFENLTFLNPQGDAIRIYANDLTALGTEIRVHRVRCQIDDSHRFDSVSLPSVDLVRIGQSGGAGGTIPSGGAGVVGGYTTTNFSHIKVTECHAAQIRTLADLKRGCAYAVVANCTTFNMYDCHHSVDGSRYIELYGLVGLIPPDSDLNNATYTNFIEIQGEHVGVKNFNFFGGGKTNRGVFVTDYGRPSESGNGYQSFKVVVQDGSVDGIVGPAYSIVSGQACVLSDCEASFCGHVASVEQGARFNGDGSTLIVPLGNEISDINSKGASAGVFIAFQAVHTVYGPCFDDKRNDLFDIPTTPSGSTTFLAAEEFNVTPPQGCADFRNRGGINGLNRNALMDLMGGSLPNYWSTSSAVTAAQVGGPTGVPTAVELTDAGSAAIRTLDSNAGVRLLQNEMLFFRFWLKQGASGAASKCGFRIQEFDSSNVQVGTDWWYGTNAIPATYTEYVFVHTAQAAACAYIGISIAPAASFAGDAALTGTTAFADVQWAPLAIGQR